MALVSLFSDPRMCEGRDVHQIVGDHTEADPAVHAVDAVAATAAQAMATFEHIDGAFAPDAARSRVGHRGQWRPVRWSPN